MIQQGERAPSFTLPGSRDGEDAEISLDDHLGRDVVVLAFYPGDFNPACSESAADLNDLDLFTMQKDLTLLAISGDSVHSHRAFAEQYGIDIPLLSDLRGEVADNYDVGAPAGAGYLTQRAIVVIDHQETVEYTWVADDVTESYDTEALREVIQSVGSDETAVARYRVGHARYIEGRRGFTRAMKAYEDREWMMAQGDFSQASDEFDEARSEFNTAVRFSEDEEALKYFERAETKAEALWRAADWLRESASAFSSGQGAKAESLRSDAEAPLEAARDIHEPPDPNDFPPDEDPAESASDKGAGTDRKAYLERDQEEVDTSLDLDEGGMAETDTSAVGSDEAGEAPPGPEGQPTGSMDTSVASNGGPTADAESFARGGGGRGGVGAAADGNTGGASQNGGADDDSAAAGIDDEEIEEIAAAIEEETEAAKDRQAGDDGSDLPNLVHGQFGEPPYESEPPDVDDLNVYGAASDSPGEEDGSTGESVDGPAREAAEDSEAADTKATREAASGDDIGNSNETGDSSGAGEAADARTGGEPTDARTAGEAADARKAGEPGGISEAGDTRNSGDAGEASEAGDTHNSGDPSGSSEVGEPGDVGEESRGDSDEDGADDMDLDLDLTDPTDDLEDEE